MLPPSLMVFFYTSTAIDAIDKYEVCGYTFEKGNLTLDQSYTKHQLDLMLCRIKVWLWPAPELKMRMNMKMIMKMKEKMMIDEDDDI